MPDQFPVSQIREANADRWERGFTLFSMERCLPFFQDFGLPPRILASPEALVRFSKDYWRADASSTRKHSDRDAMMDQEPSRVATFFASVSAGYDRDTARSLIDWFQRYITEDDLIDATSVWRSVFRHLCSLTRGDEISVPVSIETDVVASICRVVTAYLQPESLRAMDERLKAARALPKTPWEDFMEQQAANSAGQGLTVSAVDMALDLAKLIAVTHRTLQLWHELKRQVSTLDRRRLTEWANEQAVAMHLPPLTTIDPHVE